MSRNALTSYETIKIETEKASQVDMHSPTIDRNQWAGTTGRNTLTAYETQVEADLAREAWPAEMLSQPTEQQESRLKKHNKS